MATSTYIPLATYTVTGSPDAEVIFSSIPATYRDLMLVFVGTSSSGADLRLRFNSDTGANYNFVNAGVNALGAISSGHSVNQTSLALTRTATVSPDMNNHIFQIMDYSATDKHKTVLARANQAGTGNNMGAGRWANSASAISLITLYPDAASFNVGSMFSLYGIAA
jgi:hypothetical protein